MSPLAPSDSVDAFLAWLAAPPTDISSMGHPHTHGLNGQQVPISFIPLQGKVSDQEHAARLRELARSPLEDMAKPILGPIVPMRAPSSTVGDEDGKERKKTKKKKSTGDGHHSSSVAANNSPKTKKSSSQTNVA